MGEWAPAPDVVVDLPGGRRLAADVVGDPDGVPVVHLHGSPDCRLARHPDGELAAAAGIRLVAVDRRGWGWSDPAPDPAAPRAGWADDVAVLLDHLGIDRCRVSGWSAGSPWALTLAAGLGHRVEAVATYGAVAPFEALVGQVASEDARSSSGPRPALADDIAAGALAIEELFEGIAAMLLPLPPVPLDLALDLVVESWSPAARRAVESVPGLVDQLSRSLAAAGERHGGAGLRTDLGIQYAPGQLVVQAAVRCPVVVAHGDRDPIAGPGVGAWLADHVAGARLEVWEGHGHQGLLVDWPRWLATARDG